MAVAALEPALRALLATQSREIIAAYLFGSMAGGSAGARSDVPAAILWWP